MLNFTGKKIIIALLLLLLFLVFTITFALSRLVSRPIPPSVISPTPTVSQISSPVRPSPLQKTVIGQTTDEEIITNYQILSKDVLADGSTLYSLQSELVPRPNNILTKNGVAVFERILAPEEPSKAGYDRLSSIELMYGPPDEIATGSNFYGWYIEHRIYASKGFTAIGNPNTDEVYETHAYAPMSVDEYVNVYGGDINPNLGPREEGH